MFFAKFDVKNRVALFGAALLLAFPPALQAHSGATGVVKERMDRMQVMRKSMKALGEMVKGQRPMAIDAVRQLAGDINEANRQLPDSFPAGSIKGPSEALPAIWDQWERFSTLSKELSVQAAALGAAADSGDARAIKAQYVRVAEACRECHGDFRKRQAVTDPMPLVITSVEPPPPMDHSMHGGMADSASMPSEDAPPPATAAVAVEAPAVETRVAAVEESPQARGEYLYRIAGCDSCHTVSDGQPLAGGLKMETPFGVFYTPNISPDRETGIGDWTEAEFIRAMKEGLSPRGEHYYPAFPYTSYTRMSDQELRDLKAYLDDQPPVHQANHPHELSFPFDQRWMLAAWKGLFFEAGEFRPSPQKSERWNRGAYIVSGPGHCVECHSPRNFLGGLDTDALLTGNPRGPEGERVPAIHSQQNPRFGTWAAADIRFALETGMTPEGDVMGGSMAHVIENSTSYLTDEDLEALAEYLAEPL